VVVRGDVALLCGGRRGEAVVRPVPFAAAAAPSGAVFVVAVSGIVMSIVGGTVAAVS
jgi:hypothetical protein